MKKILTVFALKMEAQNLFENENVIFTGVGKINASYNLCKSIFNNRPDFVINLGSAGSSVFKAGSLVGCSKFIQRDMDAVPLGFEKWVTPFDKKKSLLEYGEHFIEDLPQVICGTGDNFDTSGAKEIYDIVDMEAYALAKICQLEKIPFVSVKYISDGADGKAADDWNEVVTLSAVKLFWAYQEICKKIIN
jgi:adenosylhomocysteine nucleosidase